MWITLKFSEKTSRLIHTIIHTLKSLLNQVFKAFTQIHTPYYDYYGKELYISFFSPFYQAKELSTIMKLTFQKDALLNGINIVLKAVPSKTTMSILECILVDASGTDIKLTGNDMELGIETKVEGDILERGKIALDAKLFSEIIRKLSSVDSQIIIESDEKLNTIISCDNSVFTIQGRDGDEFSYIPYIERDKYIALSQFTLKEIIRQTIFSISPNDSNKMMTGELFEVLENELKVVSLDGHRISIRKVELKDHYENIKVIVPGKTLSEISKILSGDNEKEVLISFSQNHIMFEFDNTVVVSRLIEGEYFRISQMLSHDYETKVTVNKKEFLDCIERATILIRENDKKPLILTISDNEMNLKLNSSFGTMNAQIMIHKNGKDIMIGFNPKFLIDALRVIEDEEISLYMMNPKSPCFIRDDEERYIYLILPVNFNTASV
jgi:DNA polymerase-3 subunit beta